ncbi:outer membrane lipid asymmetry maintenance protein MlaD [Aquisalimonas lutea]|uniref:outer membrane lipid asymmetry maintenance protein MlaD n=1 Tax=Aquisalimonas lutea TaxID=1327750 RepID=UPI0025B49F45|nr:outer membrane lipid asymmetry maintenance protein MlaD [Aquisalimonas lutea]MDN3517385.1 outer membrane lipid asymmetry maintenance protein MlaD [Aquisalimonas lutea]
MRNRRVVEIWVGLFVALGAAALFALAIQVSNIPVFESTDGYEVELRFANIGGLRTRAPVTVGGVRVGRVSDIRLDPDSYQAVVSARIQSDYRLPEDTSASIYTSGLLGEQYIALDPGGMDMYLRDGDEITLTQSALVLERLIGQFLYQMGGDNEEE